ncbi:MAG: hypothetical protein ABSG63_19855 [Spirochaetia bacterium]
MTPGVFILGEPPFARNAADKLVSRIATAFPRHDTLVTLPGIHVTQRQAFMEHLNRQRMQEGKGPLPRQEAEFEWSYAVDLIIETDTLLIRPDPVNMPLAFRADDLLQRLVPKHRIRFLGVLNAKVRDAIKRRGELWRITPLPKTPEEMRAMIDGSRIGIGGREIYYYSTLTGVRYLSCQQFEELGLLDEAQLRAHLAEIQQYLGKRNAAGYPELAFFPAEAGLTRADFSRHDFTAMEAAELRSVFEALREKCLASVPPQYRRDDIENVEWRNSLVAAMIGRHDEMITEETLLGLSPEFFMQIEWLPGGRIEEGEIVFDPAMEGEVPGDAEPLAARLRDEKPRKFIFNFVREYGDLEYVNIGRVIGSLSQRPALHGRRGVYVAAVKQRQSAEELITVIRMQKEGVREYLDQGYSLLDAMIRAEEYTEYTLDRRLGCRQIGMNLPLRVTAKRMSEKYTMADGGVFPIWTPYFEREYIRGTATDKIPPYHFASEEFTLECARLLGVAAAPNLIVGRCDLRGVPLFDDGDEVMIADSRGMPADIVVADHTGTFNDYATPLTEFTSKYALPVTRRAAFLPDAARFAVTYLDAFEKRLTRIQDDYRRRRRAYDSLFAHLPRQEPGSFAYRWRRALARLDETDPHGVRESIRGNLHL